MKKRELKKYLERLFQKYPGIKFCDTHSLPDGDLDVDCPFTGDLDCSNCILVERQYNKTWKPNTRKELLMYITYFENKILEGRTHEKKF